MIYAQPVTIKPVGRPLPAIPVKRPIGVGLVQQRPPPPHYGPPGPIYSGNHPPPPNSYNGPPPNFNGPYPPSFTGPSSHYPAYKKPPSLIHSAKPIYETGGLDAEIDYDDKFINKKQSIATASSSVQQHVHHHYHHGEGNSGAVAPIIGNNNYGYADEEFKKNFKIKNPSSVNNNLGTLNNNNNNNGVGGYANNYLSYDNKQQKTSGKQFNSGSLGNFNDFNQDLENYDDCVCVSYDRCSAIDQAGRKDDLYLAIDPRNLVNKNIEAEHEEDVNNNNNNGTLSSIRVTKAVNETINNEQEKSISVNATATIVDKEEDKRAKRDVTGKENKNEAQSVSILQFLKLVYHFIIKVKVEIGGILTVLFVCTY